MPQTPETELSTCELFGEFCKGLLTVAHQHDLEMRQRWADPRPASVASEIQRRTSLDLTSPVEERIEESANEPLDRLADQQQP
jgi:hypothetical protein